MSYDLMIGIGSACLGSLFFAFTFQYWTGFGSARYGKMNRIGVIDLKGSYTNWSCVYAIL